MKFYVHYIPSIFLTAQQHNVAYRGINPGGPGGSGTEGNGIYATHHFQRAEFFGDTILKIVYRNPQKMLIVEESDPLPLLFEDEIIEEEIQPTDSEWIKLNKLAFQNVGEWNPTAIMVELTNLMRQAGYDLVDVHHLDGWIVILDPGLIISQEPVEVPPGL